LNSELSSSLQCRSSKVRSASYDASKGLKMLCLWITLYIIAVVAQCVGHIDQCSSDKFSSRMATVIIQNQRLN
jgi:hypothetical protein